MMREEIIRIVDQRIRKAHVTRKDFSELKSIVRDIAEAQKRTEKGVEELAEAQKKTEEVVRRLATKVGELDDNIMGYQGVWGMHLRMRHIGSCQIH